MISQENAVGFPEMTQQQVWPHPTYTDEGAPTLRHIKFNYFVEMFGWSRKQIQLRRREIVAKGEKHAFYATKEGGLKKTPLDKDFEYLRNCNELELWLTFAGYTQLVMKENGSAVADRFRDFVTEVLRRLFTEGSVSIQRPTQPAIKVKDEQYYLDIAERLSRMSANTDCPRLKMELNSGTWNATRRMNDCLTGTESTLALPAPSTLMKSTEIISEFGAKNLPKELRSAGTLSTRLVDEFKRRGWQIPPKCLKSMVMETQYDVYGWPRDRAMEAMPTIIKNAEDLESEKRERERTLQREREARNRLREEKRAQKAAIRKAKEDAQRALDEAHRRQQDRFRSMFKTS